MHLKSGLIRGGDLWWEWHYKNGDLWWEWPDKRGDLWWEWPYKKGDLWWEWPYKRGTNVQTNKTKTIKIKDQSLIELTNSIIF